MSNWRNDEQLPTDFLNVVYDVKVEQESGDENDDSDDEDDAYSPHRSPERPSQRHRVQTDEPSARPSTSRSRSRSPIRMKFSPESVPSHGEDDGAILTPDAHALYVSRGEEHEKNSSESNERRMRRPRGRPRGVRGRRVRYPCRGRKGNSQWEVGHPLQEIWRNDEDVPPELSSRSTVPSIRITHEQPQTIFPFTHWPALLQRTEYTAARNRNFRKRCVVCLREGRKTQTTPYCCETCQVPLCISNCFKSYHTSR